MSEIGWMYVLRRRIANLFFFHSKSDGADRNDVVMWSGQEYAYIQSIILHGTPEYLADMPSNWNFR